MPDYGESSYRRFLQGDKTALESLIRTYSDLLVRFAYTYVKDSAVAEDVVADSFAVLFMKSRKIPDDAHLRAYLYKITRNKCMDFLRRHRRDVPLCDVENVLQSSDAHARLWQQERDKTLYLCLQALPDAYREVLQLSYIDGFSVPEVCRLMGKNTKQIYNLLARAKPALKEMLQKEGITHEDI